MRANVKSLIVISFIFLLISACSRCYKCTNDVVISVNGVNDTSKAEEDFCTANSKELQDKEKDGYRCVAN